MLAHRLAQAAEDDALLGQLGLVGGGDADAVEERRNSDDERQRMAGLSTEFLRLE